MIINNGAVAGQIIDHCHWHIVPRFANDSIHWRWPQGKYSGDELSQMKSRIEQEIDNAARANERAASEPAHRDRVRRRRPVDRGGSGAPRS